MHFLSCFFITLGIFPLIGFWSMLLAFVVGVLKEVVDKIEYGLFDKKDLLADCIGIIAGGAICGLLCLLSSLVQW